MIAQWQRERPAFEEIVRMVDQDALVGELVAEPIASDPPALRARRERYRALLARIGVSNVWRDEHGRVWFDYQYATSGFGSIASTGIKRYVYATSRPAPLWPSLDGDPGKRFEDNFRHIDGAWYLMRAYS